MGHVGGAGQEPHPQALGLGDLNLFFEQEGALTCFSEREVIFAVVHSQDRVVVGG